MKNSQSSRGSRDRTADELKDLSKANENLAEKILPKIEEYGFLDKDEVYERI